MCVLMSPTCSRARSFFLLCFSIALALFLETNFGASRASPLTSSSHRAATLAEDNLRKICKEGGVQKVADRELLLPLLLFFINEEDDADTPLDPVPLAAAVDSSRLLYGSSFPYVLQGEVVQQTKEPQVPRPLPTADCSNAPPPSPPFSITSSSPTKPSQNACDMMIFVACDSDNYDGGLHKILSLLESEDVDVRTHPVKVLANLDLVAEEANQEKVVEARGLGSLLNLLQSSEDEIIRRVATGTVGNLAMNYKLQIELKEEHGIHALLGMVCSHHPHVLALGIANFAKCEYQGAAQGYKTGRSLLIDDGVLPWIVANANNDASPIWHHIELALCHLTQHEVNAKDLVAGGALWELACISWECSQEDICYLAQRTLNTSGTFQPELKRLHLVY